VLPALPISRAFSALLAQLEAKAEKTMRSSRKGVSVTSSVYQPMTATYRKTRLSRPTGAAILPQWVRAPRIWSQERAFRCSLFACCRLL
jgi:hypothetical protein